MLLVSCDIRKEKHVTTYQITVNAASGSIVNIGTCGVSCSFPCTISSSFDPSDIQGLLHWYRSDRFVTTSGSFVTRWDDLIGNVNGSSSNIDRRPSIVTNAINGYAAIRFNDGVTQNEQTNLDDMAFVFNVLQPYSIVLVWKLNAPAIGTFDGSGDDQKSGIYNTYAPGSSSLYLRAYGPGEHVSGTTIVSSTSSATTYQAMNVDAFGTTALTSTSMLTSVFNNDALVVTGTLGTTNLSTLYLCSNGSEHRLGARMDVVEMMVFTGSLSSSDVTALTDYANTRYAL